MMKHSYIAAALMIAGSVLPAAAEGSVLSGAGLSAAEIQVPAPQAPKSNQWLTLRKIAVNEAQPDMNDTLVGIVRGVGIDQAVKELNDNGFKARALQDNHGGYMVFVDVSGQDAADLAVGLARYYYITDVKVGREVYNRIFGLTKSRASYAVRIGTIKGGMNHSPVDVKIDHDAKTITGGANLSPVDLKFAWSTEEVTVEGGANHSPVKYTVNWKNGLLEGYADNAPLKVEFDLGEGYADQTIVSLKGYAGNAPVDLTYNKVNGHIGGGMGFSQVDVNLVNCDIYDFLQYFFLFVKAPGK